MVKLFALIAAALIAIGSLAAAAPAPSSLAQLRARLPEDETIYFLLPDRFDNGDPTNDRGGLTGDRLATGFDPTDKSFYHGGDLAGLTRRLDYIEGLGATAIWLGPIFVNKPVQGAPGHESAGYHGYWITDFTRVDAHLGTNAEFAALVRAAHARGMKVYMDIIVNHTADAIRYRECPQNDCAYRSRADYPDSRGSAYTPYVPSAEAHTKVPDWLNDPRYYHNRGDSTFKGESKTLGDFVGLDDIKTEDPHVVRGFIEVFDRWIDDYGIDGFRIDTAKHVNPEFWAAFVPAIQARARTRGIPNFHIFGEVFDDTVDPGALAVHTRVDKLPAVLDFALRRAILDTVAGTGGTDIFERLLAADALYEGGEATARRLPTFVSNHDNGRFAFFARTAFPAASDAGILQRTRLAYAILFGLRGVPTIYSGDEQGFVGHGGDQDAREDMFGSRVPSYNDNRLLGTTRTTATPSFDPAHPLYRALVALAKTRAASPALRRGGERLRFASEKPGLLAVSRFDPVTGAETLVAFNTSTARIRANIEVAPASRAFTALAGSCPARAWAAGSVAIDLPPLGFAYCQAIR